jgi:hypothetical protein
VGKLFDSIAIKHAMQRMSMLTNETGGRTIRSHKAAVCVGHWKSYVHFQLQRGGICLNNEISNTVTRENGQ